MCKKGLVKYDAAHIEAKIATTTYSLYYSNFFLRAACFVFFSKL